jgi:single stranded DNA-binding protein
MYQNLILIGKLGTEPVLRNTQKGQPVVTFQFYTREKRWNGQDTPTTLTIWWHISMFGEKAKAVAAGAHKGDRLMIEGSLNPAPNGNPRVYQLKSGEWAGTYDVTARMFRFLDARQTDDDFSEELCALFEA